MVKGFYTIEGVEGSGKTSLIKYIQAYLENKGEQVVVTREPGGIEIAEQIRSVILDKKNTEMDGQTEALLYAAARRQHLVEKIIPSISEGKVVLCDRFIDSSLAYQGYARGLGIDEVRSINEFAIGEFTPEITFYLDLDPNIGLLRIGEDKDREINRLDLEDLDFHNRVRTGYLKLLKRYPDRIKLIDANQTIENVFLNVKEKLNGIL